MNPQDHPGWPAFCEHMNATAGGFSPAIILQGDWRPEWDAFLAGWGAGAVKVVELMADATIEAAKNLGLPEPGE